MKKFDSCTPLDRQCIYFRDGSRILVGGAITFRRGRRHTFFFSKFPTNCTKLRKFWTVGGRGALGAPPLDPPMYFYLKNFIKNYSRKIYSTNEFL